MRLTFFQKTKKTEKKKDAIARIGKRQLEKLAKQGISVQIFTSS